MQRVVVAAAFLLAGCGLNENPWGGWPARELAHSETGSRPQPYDAHCRAVAKQRADDAVANGYGLDIEDTVYKGTYQDCMNWRTQHAQ